MKFKKSALFLLAMFLGCPYAAAPARAAAYAQDGTACISVTVDARSMDDGNGVNPDTDGDNNGNKKDDGDKGPDDSKKDDDGKGPDDSKKDDGDKGPDDSKKDNDGKGPDDREKDDGDKNPDDSKKDGGRKDGGDKKGGSPDGGAFFYPGTVPDKAPAADHLPDHTHQMESGAENGDTEKEAGSIRKDGDSSADDSSQEQDAEDTEAGRPGDDCAGAGTSGSLAGPCFLAALLSGAVLMFLLHRRKRCFHGILADDMDGISFRGDRDGAVSVPLLIEKLNQGEVSFQEYEDMVMGSRAETLLPAGTGMRIHIIRADAAETAFAGKADERRMFEILRKAADTARTEKQTAMTDVMLEHAGTGIKIPLHFVFR